jgi:hypothetical protein
MTSHRIVVAAAALAVLSGCATSTNGTGSRGNAPTTPAPHSAAPRTASTPAPSTATSATASVSVVPAPSSPVRTATVPAGSTTYLVKIWTETTNADCAAHAYGAPVISYLQAHPCSGVTRLLATTTVNGKSVGFAQSAIGFKGTAPDVYTTAGRFRSLVTQEGTGNLNDLLREGRRLPSGPTAVPSPDAFSALGQDAGVTIVDAWYLDQPTPDNDPALVKMAHDIFLQI